MRVLNIVAFLIILPRVHEEREREREREEGEVERYKCIPFFVTFMRDSISEIVSIVILFH